MQTVIKIQHDRLKLGSFPSERLMLVEGINVIVESSDKQFISNVTIVIDHKEEEDALVLAYEIGALVQGELMSKGL